MLPTITLHQIRNCLSIKIKYTSMFPHSLPCMNHWSTKKPCPFSFHSNLSRSDWIKNRLINRADALMTPSNATVPEQNRHFTRMSDIYRHHRHRRISSPRRRRPPVIKINSNCISLWCVEMTLLSTAEYLKRHNLLWFNYCGAVFHRGTRRTVTAFNWIIIVG